MTSAHPDDDDMLAAEYVLGTLDLAQRSAAEARARLDQSFAARVRDWEQRLSGLNDDYAEAAAPNLLPKIEARLFAKEPARRGRRLSGLFAAALTAAAAVAIVTFFALTPAAQMKATLTADASALRYEAVISGDILHLDRVAGSDAETGKDYELWIIDGDKPPVSLGLLTAQSTTIPAPPASAGFVLAITLEPAGGAPNGSPTGPIVAAGKLSQG